MLVLHLRHLLLEIIRHTLGRSRNLHIGFIAYGS